MVTVAKGLDVPIKVVFPRGVMAVLEQGIWNKPVGVQFSMLGLGDIVIPGILILISFCPTSSCTPNCFSISNKASSSHSASSLIITSLLSL